jgi:hypothetical protein
MSDQPKPDDAKARKAAADLLRSEIDDVVTGKAAPVGRPSFRDFIERKMAEDSARPKDANKPSGPRDNSAIDTPRAPKRERE